MIAWCDAQRIPARLYDPTGSIGGTRFPSPQRKIDRKALADSYVHEPEKKIEYVAQDG